MSLINYMTRVRFGYGSLEALSEEAASAGIARPLVVTDKGVVAAGLLERVLARLADRKAATLFDATPANPHEAAVQDAARCFREADCDGIVALGGGSSIDLAKGVAVCARHDGELKRYAAIEGGAARITSNAAPIIAIPTTAGTGSEVGSGAILILADGRKLGVISPHLLPKAAICDPELTLTLPAALTAATGMDAIAHCVETFLAPAINYPAEAIAIDGLRRAWRHIETATFEPHNRIAREQMMSASMQGALAFQKGLGCVHSISHALGAIDPRLHHGTLNALLLPAVLSFNRTAQSVVDAHKMERIAEAIGVARVDAIVPAFRQLNARLGLPDGLRALGVTDAVFDALIDYAFQDRGHANNPRTPSREDYVAILNESM
ncbi:iron-containing alcohol dehydrogenase [Paraburkholderia sp. ZP32-5]|uniref:iron-containing alcohol dehydrogenase n=1 Tax=Paraburkholderia sp. ZP32-5 TaxID=2883245 RepID=UPI001F16478E|nr:iron-containing alcohol dehydrogenase [Paraburkholderia sp. ZP32-5]